MSFLNKLKDAPDFHRYSKRAMATLFEIVIEEKDEEYAAQAAKAAFELLLRIEGEISRFLPGSDVYRINNAPAEKEIVLGEYAYEAVLHAEEFRNLTAGYFDARIAAVTNSVKESSPENIKPQNPAKRGEIFFNEKNYGLRKSLASVKLDLGGSGKGYALDKMGELLAEWGIENYLIHGGGSSVKAAGSPQNSDGWLLSISDPRNLNETVSEFTLRDFSFSGSGIKKGRHIINPLSGLRAVNRLAAWAAAPGAELSDALSTAFMMMPENEIEKLCKENHEIEGVIIYRDKSKYFSAGQNQKIFSPALTS